MTPSLAALPPMDVAGRLERLARALPGAGCGSLVVGHGPNLRYLSGFTGSAGTLVVTSGAARLVTDGRYEEQAAAEVAATGARVEVVVGRTRAALDELVAEALVGEVGLEADHVTWAEQRVAEQRWAARHRLVATTGLVEALRIVKDDGEVARIQAAAAITDEALAATAPLLEEGPTEVAFAAALEDAIRAGGADDLSFATIVASGPNGSRPHHRPGQRRIVRGDLVTVDVGALVDGYHSDMTRTLPVGGRAALAEPLVRLLDVVTEAQAAGVAAVAAGVEVRAVDRACRAVIERAGWGDRFVHGTGHGVGLDIHEDPPVSGGGDATLAAGHVVTVEPGVYLPGVGGARVEDTVVVVPKGCRPLTRAPKS